MITTIQAQPFTDEIDEPEALQIIRRAQRVPAILKKEAAKVKAPTR